MPQGLGFGELPLDGLFALGFPANGLDFKRLATGEVEADEMAAALDRHRHRDLLPVGSGRKVKDDVLAGLGKLVLPLGPPLDASLATRSTDSAGTQVKGERPGELDLRGSEEGLLSRGDHRDTALDRVDPVLFG